MSPRRIAVDARPLCHPGNGIYRYTSELLQRLCRMGGEWFFYAPQAYDRAPFELPNVTHRVAGLPARLRASQTAHWYFPRWCRRDRVQVFWGTRHQLPMSLDSAIRSVLTVYDLVWKEHGDTMRFPGRQIEAFFMPRALARADSIVTISQFTRREIERYYPEYAGKVSVVPCASLLSGAGGDAPATPSHGRTYFLFVGTLEPRKNLGRLLRAYRRYAEAEPYPLPLKIVGGRGWGGENIESRIRELELGDRVELLGKVSDDRLRSLYAGARALAMPSLYEGFGLPVVEALSLGIPVITSRQSAMSEVAGSAGVYVDPGSEEEIAAALRRLSKDMVFYESLREKTVLEAGRYDWERSAEAMARLLLE